MLGFSGCYFGTLGSRFDVSGVLGVCLYMYMYVYVYIEILCNWGVYVCTCVYIYICSFRGPQEPPSSIGGDFPSGSLRISLFLDLEV